jgi:hypothetical protein
MKTLSTFFAAFFLCMSASGLLGQQPDQPTVDYAAEVKKTVYQMMETYQNLPKTKNAFPLLEFFDKSYETDRIRISIEERVEQKTDNYFDLENLFSLLINTPGLEIDYRINEIIDVYGTENVGYCLFKASYEAKRNGQVYIIGDETVTYFFKRIDGRYKAVRGHFVQVRDRINRAVCPCRLYKSQADENAYMVQVEMPVGTAFAQKVHTFSFKYLKGLHVIEVDGFFYHWEGDQKILVMDNAVGGKSHSDAGQQIGTAKTAAQAITVILRDYMYRRNCSAIKFED